MGSWMTMWASGLALFSQTQDDWKSKLWQLSTRPNLFQPKCTSCLFCLLPSTPAWKEFLQKAGRKMIRVVEDGPFGSLHKLEHLKGIERLSNSLKHALQYDGDAMNLCKKEHTVSCKQARIKLSSRWMSCQRAVLWSLPPSRTRTIQNSPVLFPLRSKVSLGIASSEWRQYRAVGSIQYEAKSKSCVQVGDLWTWEAWKKHVFSRIYGDLWPPWLSN